MRTTACWLLFSALLLALPFPAWAKVVPDSQNATDKAVTPPEQDTPTLSGFEWATPAKGLELGISGFTEETPAPPLSPPDAPAAPAPSTPAQGQDDKLVIVKIDPKYWEFDLFAASLDPPSRSLSQWAKDKGLVAAINAGMYLQDNLTHTGYLRIGEHLNNSRTGSRLGAFFVSRPKVKTSSPVNILEKGHPNLEARLKEYEHVIQNFRFFDSKGRNLWGKNTQKNSIALVGRERKSAKILFILCQRPLSSARLGELVKEAGLELGTTMYVEGGSKAGLLLQPPGSEARIWNGRQSIVGRGEAQPLPNIIGVRPKPEKK